MERLLYICLPAIAFGIAAQQVIELGDVFIPVGRLGDYKKPLSKVISVIIGAALGASLPMLPAPTALDLILVGLATAAFSEAWNALLKMLVYTKEIKKARAAHEFSAAGAISLDAVSRK